MIFSSAQSFSEGLASVLLRETNKRRIVDEVYVYDDATGLLKEDYDARGVNFV